MEKKYVIVSSVKEGNRLLRRENKKHPGTLTANVSCHHLLEFARDIVFKERAMQGKLRGGELLDTMSCAALLDGIMKESWKEDWFLPKNCLGLSTAKEVLEALNILRMGQPTDSYKQKLFGKEVCKEKQLFELWDKYVKKLREQDCYDEALLYTDVNRLLEYAGRERYLPRGRFYISGDCFETLTAVERTFLEKLTEGQYEVFTQELPTKKLLIQKATFFKGYGMANEIEYVAKKIVEEKQRFGEVSVLYTSPEYEPFLSGVFGNRGIPCRLTSAHSAVENSYVAAMLAVLRFVENGYVYEDLKHLMRMPRLRAVYMEGEEEKRAALAKQYFKTLRAGIGWGKKRYTEYLSKHKEEESSPDAEKFLELLADITGIFGQAEESNETVFWKLVDVAKKYIYAPLEWKEIMPVLQKEAEVLKQLPKPVTEKEQVLLFKERISALRVDTAEEQDAVSVALIGNGTMVQERRFVYILGLSAEAFGRPQTDSAVFSDKEKKLAFVENSGFIDLREERETRRNGYLYKTIQTMEEGPEGNRLYLGYSSFDTKNLRETSPAVAYLRLRELAEVQEADVEYMGYPGVMEQAVIVKEASVWENSLTEDIKEASEASEAAGNTETTVVIPEAKFSATALQSLITCPLQYYYQRVKWLPNEDYKKRLPDQWLGAADRGTLAHEILERYCNRWFVGVKPDKVETSIQEASFKECVNEAVEAMIAACPFDSAAALDIEKEEVIEKCHHYLCSVHEELSAPGNPWVVLACEAEFPDVELYYNEQGRCNPTDKGAVCLHLNGFMDRVDGYVDANDVWHLRILDYKSGSRARLEKEIKAQQKIQHIVYALAAVEMGKAAGKNVVVDAVSFLHFFEEKVGDRVYTLMGSAIAEFPDKVRQIVVEVLRSNTYTVLERLSCNQNAGKTDKLKKTEEACQYCTYKDICREEKYMGEEW